jgi:hypothetical protein
MLYQDEVDTDSRRMSVCNVFEYLWPNCFGRPGMHSCLLLICKLQGHEFSLSSEACAILLQVCSGD